MAKSQTEVEKNKRLEAVRRLRYSHPLVIGRCRHTKKAWIEQVEEIENRPLKASIEVNFVHVPVRNITTMSSTRALNTKKAKLRGLFWNERASSCQSLPHGTPENDDESCSILQTNQIFPHIQKQAQKPITSRTLSPKKQETSPRKQVTVDTNSQTLSENCSEIASYFDGWGQRRTHQLHNELNNLKINVKTIEPLLRKCPVIFQEELTSSNEEEQVWNQDDSIVKSLPKLNTTKSSKKLKDVGKVAVKFSNGS